MNIYKQLGAAGRRASVIPAFIAALISVPLLFVASPIIWIITGTNLEDQLGFMEDKWDSYMDWVEGKDPVTGRDLW